MEIYKLCEDHILNLTNFKDFWSFLAKAPGIK